MTQTLHLLHEAMHESMVSDTVEIKRHKFKSMSIDRHNYYAQRQSQSTHLEQATGHTLRKGTRVDIQQVENNMQAEHMAIQMSTGIQKLHCWIEGEAPPGAANLFLPVPAEREP